MPHLLFTTPAGVCHDTPTGHPETAARIPALLGGLLNAEARPLGLDIRTTTPATPYGLRVLHDWDYVQSLAAPAPHGHALDADTYQAPGTYEAALHSAGGAIEGVQTLLDGHGCTAFVATRPPGHHARFDAAMGFCFFGNAALAAKTAIACGARVAVLDFDVHHGNGTQELLWDEPNAFFASTHRLNAWPGTGRVEETGAHGTIHNRTLKSGASSRRMQEAWAGLLEEARAFAPDIVIVSAGFDAHQYDTMGSMNWQYSDYRYLGQAIRDLADTTANGRVLSVLEGGYNLPVLARAGRSYMEGLIHG